MVGHDHVKVPKVPDPSIYVVKEGTKMHKVQELLAKKGLKDPWIRNYVWRDMMADGFKNPNWILLRFITHSWKIWIPIVGITIAIENFLGIDYHGHAHDFTKALDFSKKHEHGGDHH